MRVTIVAYVIFAVAIILATLLSPYGSKAFEMIRWWPVFGILAGAVICFLLWAKVRLKRILPIQIVLLLSVPIAAIRSERNDVFVAELTGVVTRRYVGGHALKSLEIRTPSGAEYRIEGVSPVAWESISIGDAFVKKRGLVLTLSGFDSELFQDCNIAKIKRPTEGGGGQLAARPVSEIADD